MFVQRTVSRNVQMFQMSYDGFLVNGMPGTGKTPIERLLIGVFSTWYLGSIAGVIWAHYAECSNLIINPKLMLRQQNFEKRLFDNLGTYFEHFGTLIHFLTVILVAPAKQNFSNLNFVH